ncbi:hypothetical protein, partial [uncultured Porphyromonas sp.]|uniref:hypothetical protein n=1 Tax=uncultured Porphyromonas sp. TaxID=159274 RepID=UPI00266D6BCC
TAFNQRNLYRHGGNLKFFRGDFLFSSEGRKNSSEVSFDSSEVSFDSSEEFRITSVANFYLPVDYLKIPPEESEFRS